MSEKPPMYPDEIQATEFPEQFCDVLGERVYVRLIILKTKQEGGKTIGDIVTQHVHKDGHFSMLVKGKVRAWMGNQLYGDFTAPYAIWVAPNVGHTFQALENDTWLVCNHVTDGRGEPDIIK